MKTQVTPTMKPVSSSDAAPAFRDAVAATVEELRTLQTGWDGYASDPIDGRTIENAKALIWGLPDDIDQPPQVVPMTRGRVQFEWHLGSRHLELEFETPTTIHSLRWDEADGFEEERIQPNFTQRQAIELIRWCVIGNGNGQS